MTKFWTYSDPLLFAILPYIAFFVFFLVTIQRYRQRSFTYSSLSSQFLENRQHFWGVVPLHYGILTVLAGHILAFLMPAQILEWNSNTTRLYALEATGLMFGFLTVIGLIAAIVRRLTVRKVERVTSIADWIVYTMLFLQVVTGVAIALVYPWGSSWFATTASPYFWSIVKLNPQVDLISSMPWLVKFHIINAYALIGFFPFTRLVHILVVPNPYLWRKPQVARWYSKPERSIL
jgi:nitrate reductase gamma subunit